jgi:hypothetical protein
MTPLRRFALAISPFFILGACSELIGLSDFEKGDPPEGEGGEESTGGKGASSGKGGTSGSQSGGNSGAGRGGTGTGGSRGGQGGTGNTGPGGESGEAGMGGEPPEGGTGGMPGGRGGNAGAGRGGMSGAGMGAVGGAGAGSGGAGNAGGGMGGGSGSGSCTTVTVPLRSAGFDSDTTAWVPYDDGMGPPALPIIVAAAVFGITPPSPANIAHLGGADGMSATAPYYAGMFQSIMVPAGAVTLTLSGSRQVRTQESSTSFIYDRMAIQLYEDALDPATYIGQFQTFNNLTPANAWATFSSEVAVTSFAGQTVDLDMWAECDDSLISDFFIDSLSLTARVCL